MEFKPWYYLQESVESEVLLTESFKEKKLQFINQGTTREEIDEYFPIFQRIQKTPYKSISNVIPGLTVAIPDRRNIDMYPNFDQLKIFVDYMRSREDLEERAFTDIQTTGKPIVDNNILEISYADNPQACITYKGDLPYSWCVARKTENYYYNYRLQGNEPSFYFVKNKIRTEKELSSWKPEDIKEGIKWKDPWHFFVIQVNLGANLNDQNALQYVVTSAQNDSDQRMSWSQIVELEPALNGMQDIFKPVALPPEDRAFIERWQNGATDEEFDRMTYRDKSKFMSVYVRLGQGLTDNQFASLPSKLWNEYLNLGVGLTDKQFEMIKDKRELVRRYTELSIKKFNNLMKQNVSFSYMMPSEWKIIENYSEQLDFDNMSFQRFTELLYIENGVELLEKAGKLKQIINSMDDQQVYNLMRTNPQAISKLLIKHKKELTPSMIHLILMNTSDLSNIEETLETKNLKKINLFNDNLVYELLRYTKDKEGVIHILLNYKEELTRKNVFDILRYSQDVKAIEEKIGEENVKEINLLGDDDVSNLLLSALDKEGVIHILLNYKEELTRTNIWGILRYSKEVKAIEKEIGEENLNKINELNDYQIDQLMSEAEDTQGVIHILLNYKEELTRTNIWGILKFSKEVKAIEEKIGEENLNKINELNDYQIDRLMSEALDTQGVIHILLNYKEELTRDNIYWILEFSKDIKAIEKEIGEENLKKINELNDYQISNLLYYAKDKEGVIHILLNYKEELTRTNIWGILKFSKEVKAIEEKIGEENLNKINELSDFKIDRLMSEAEDTQGVIHILLNYKEELTRTNIWGILKFSKEVKAIEEKIGEENLNKINELNDFEIGRLMSEAEDTQGVIHILLNYKEELTRKNIYKILKFSKEVKAIEKEIGEENLNKINELNDYQIDRLMSEALDKEGIRYIIDKYRKK